MVFIAVWFILIQDRKTLNQHWEHSFQHKLIPTGNGGILKASQSSLVQFCLFDVQVQAEGSR